MTRACLGWAMIERQQRRPDYLYLFCARARPDGGLLLLPNSPEIVFAERSDVEAKFLRRPHLLRECQVVEITQGHFTRRLNESASKRQVNMVGQNLTAPDKMLLFRGGSDDHRTPLCEHTFADLHIAIAAHENEVRIVAELRMPAGPRIRCSSTRTPSTSVTSAPLFPSAAVWRRPMRRWRHPAAKGRITSARRVSDGQEQPGTKAVEAQTPRKAERAGNLAENVQRRPTTRPKYVIIRARRLSIDNAAMLR